MKHISTEISYICDIPNCGAKAPVTCEDCGGDFCREHARRGFLPDQERNIIPEARKVCINCSKLYADTGKIPTDNDIN